MGHGSCWLCNSRDVARLGRFVEEAEVVLDHAASRSEWLGVICVDLITKPKCNMHERPRLGTMGPWL